MDYPLLPADMGIPLLFTVKTNNFTSEKVGRTSGELKKKPFLGIQSYHLRSAKILGSTGWNWLGPHMMPWEAPNDLKTFHMDRIHHHESSEPTRGPQRTNSAPLKSLTGRKAPEKFQVPASKTFSIQRVVYCDNKDSFMNIKYAHSSRKRVSTRASISVAIRTLDFFGRISLSIATMFGLLLSHRWL